MRRWIRFIIIITARGASGEEREKEATSCAPGDEGGARVYGFFNENQS